MITEPRFLTPDESSTNRLCQTLNCSSIMAAILVNRGFTTADLAGPFLNPTLGNLCPPCSMMDMEKAVDRIITGIKGKEKILIFGDYDLDGITATALLYKFLISAGVPASYYIPHRTREGYSIQKHHIRDLGTSQGHRLIITADCGSSSHEALAEAQSEGIDVVVTDHHHVPAVPPPALALLNPKRPDCEAGFDYLAGVGVAFSLVICLRTALRSQGFWKETPEPNLKDLTDLVALGTVADQVPLIEDNRILVHTGLGQINLRKRPGLDALAAVSGIREAVNSESVAFRLAPRLNAAGRLDHAHLAVKLLLAEKRNQADHIAQSLNRLNTERQGLEQAILNEIEEILDDRAIAPEAHAIVMDGHRWHEGVIGIVASRLVDKHRCPVALIATKDGMGKGSARSVPGFDLFEGLKTCATHLEAYGGHAMAAGFRVKPDNIPPFKHAFEEAVMNHGNRNPSDIDLRSPVDLTIQFPDITEPLIDELESLQPFGNGNPEPVFCAKDLSIVSQKIVGKNHRQLVLAQPATPSNACYHAIQFNVENTAPLDKMLPLVTFHLRWNRWNGKKQPQLIILSV